MVGQVAAPAGQVHTRQNDLVETIGDQLFDLRNDLASGHGSRISPAIGNDAEGTAMVASGLHLNIGAGAALQAVHHVSGGGGDRHDVVDQRLWRIGGQQGRGQEGLFLHLFGIADHAGHFGHVCKHVRVDLGGASGDDDGGVGAVFCGASDGLARLPHGLIGDGACVDDHRIVQASGLCMVAHHLGLIGIQPASQCQDVDGIPCGRRIGWCGHPPLCARGRGRWQEGRDSQVRLARI